MAKWRVAEAKQRFSELLRGAAEEPQQILNRNRLVATVIDAESFESFDAWRGGRGRPLAEAFSELRQIGAREGYRLKIPPRRNRKSPLSRVLARTAR